MKHRNLWILAGAATMLATTIAVSASSPQAQVKPALTKNVGELTAAEEEEFSTAAEATIERVCILCHPFENIVKTRRNPKEWADQVTVMSQRGAPGTEPDFVLVKK